MRSSWPTRSTVCAQALGVQQSEAWRHREGAKVAPTGAPTRSENSYGSRPFANEPPAIDPAEVPTTIVGRDAALVQHLEHAAVRRAKRSASAQRERKVRLVPQVYPSHVAIVRTASGMSPAAP